MPKAHRHGDGRFCGAKTNVQNQDSVTVNQKLWAIEGSINTDNSGGLHPSPDKSVTIHGIPIVVHRPEDADPDDKCPEGAPHCNPYTTEGSDNVTAYG